MKIEETKEGEVCICKIIGEINIETSPILREFFQKVSSEGVKRVLIDFRDVTYIDSSGLATLIEMYQRVKKMEGDMRLANLSPKIKNIFEITRLNRFFPIFESREEALKDFR